MRFQKRIKVAKGVSLNLSKSGTSLSFGGSGSTINVGPRGTYSTMSIPGTGISFRNKIDRKAGTRKHYESLEPEKEVRNVIYSIELDELGSPVFKDSNENIVTDPAIINRIKRTNVYKEGLNRISASRCESINNESEILRNIHKKISNLINEVEWLDRLKDLPCKYTPMTFNDPMPTMEECINEAEELAQSQIKKGLFGISRKKASIFIEKNAPLLYEEKIKTWHERKAIIENLNHKNKIDHETYLTITKKILKGDSDYILDTIRKIIEETSLSIEFNIDFQYLPDGRLFVDLDLPEIENFPMKKASLLSSGKISIKEKTEKELKDDYATSVCGLVFYFAGIFFNISPTIKEIIISGYTQRISLKTGNIEDVYILSVIFNRELFGKINYQNINPILALENFEHRINITSRFEMKPIEPFQANI